MKIASIKNKTYHNFTTVVNYIVKHHHYRRDVAVSIAHRLFEELNPLGLSMQDMLNQLVTAEDFYDQTGIWDGE
jgi:hypothetical protein